MNKKNIIIISLLTILHFCCDLICGYKVVSCFGNYYFNDIWYTTRIYFIYNIFAFLLQPVIGIILDKINLKNKERIILLISTVLLILGTFINIWYISITLLGIANQIFHVSGGKICTNISTSKSSHLGVFVSFGAIGLSLGVNNIAWCVPIVVILYILLSIIIIFIKEEKEEEIIQKPKLSRTVLIFSIIFLSIAVFIRSFLGKIIHYEFIPNLLMILGLGLASTIGKCIGGFIRDKIGSLLTIIISMVSSVILLLFFQNIYLLIFIGIIMINISMPITLYELNRINEQNEGFNFGLLAAILFIGVTVGSLYQYEIISYIFIIIISCLLTIFSIYYVTRKKVK